MTNSTARLLLLACLAAALSGATGETPAAASTPRRSTDGAEVGTSASRADDSADAIALAARVAARLAELDAAPELPLAEQVAALVPLGDEALPRLFDVLVELGYELPVDEDEAGEDGEARQPRRVRLNQRLGEAVVLALGQLDRAALLALLESLPGSTEATPAQRLVGMRLLGTHGSPAELRLLLRLATPADGEAPTRAAGLVVETATSAILTRDESGCSRIRTLMGEAHPGLVASLVRGLGGVPSKRAMSALSGLFTGSESVDRIVLNQIGQVAAELPPPASSEILRNVRALLGANSAAVVREAALALGWLEDYESLGTLIELLDGTDKGLAKNAQWSLEHMTGLQMRENATRWRAWHQDELSWWKDEARELFSVLAGGTPAEAAAAINVIASRRAFRHELAGELTRALQHESSAVRIQTCQALGRLGSRTVLKPLVGLLDSRDTGVSQAALAALVAITQLDLPPHASAWKEIL